MKKKISVYDKPSLEAALYGMRKRIIPRMPPIVLSDFDIDAPDNLRNSIVLPHNGARARMYQMYKLIIPSLLTRPLTALMDIDFEDLRAWWEHFSAFALCTCDVDAKVMLLGSDKIPSADTVSDNRRFQRVSLQFDEQTVIILPILFKNCAAALTQFCKYRRKIQLRAFVATWKSLSNCLLKTYDIVESYLASVEGAFGDISFTGAEYYVTKPYLNNYHASSNSNNECMLEIMTGFIKDDVLLERIIERNPSFEGITCTQLNAITAQHFESIDGYITRLEDWEQEIFRAWLDGDTADRLLSVVRRYQNQTVDYY